MVRSSLDKEAPEENLGSVGKIRIICLFMLDSVQPIGCPSSAGESDMLSCVTSPPWGSLLIHWWSGHEHAHVLSSSWYWVPPLNVIMALECVPPL